MSTDQKEVQMQIEEEPYVCSRKEKLAHAVGVLGHDSAYTLWSSWITPFMTDVLVLPPAFLAVVLAVARFFDAFTDISMGVIADRTRSKFGRFRPWVMRAGPLFCLCMALSFLKPPVGVTGLCIFAAFMYLVTGSIAFTAVDIPFWSLPAAMTSNPEERGGIIASTTTASNAITGLIGVLMPIGLSFFGQYEWTSYFYVAVIVAVFAAIMYMICFRNVREHVIPDDTEKFHLVLALKNIFTNKPLLCVQLSNIFCIMSLIIKGGFNYYYSVNNLGDIKYMTVLSVISTVGMIAGAVLFGVLNKYIGKKKCMFAIAVVYVITCVALFFAGWSNVYIVFAGSAVCTVCVGAVIVCVNAMIADTIEYAEWKTGQRNEAMITSTRCFVTKCVQAVAGFIIMVIIGTTGYVAQAEVQSLPVLNAFHLVYTLVSALIMILAVVPMFFYDLTEERHAEIMAELKARKAGKQ